MKRWISLVSIIVMIMVTCVGSAFADGYTLDYYTDMEFLGGLKFGQSMNAAKEAMQKIYGCSSTWVDQGTSTNGDPYYYVNSSRYDAEIAGFKGSDVLCFFTNGTGSNKLEQVTYELPSGATDTMLDALTSKYGTPFLNSSNSDDFWYCWVWQINKTPNTTGKDFTIYVALYVPKSSQTKCEIRYWIRGAVYDEWNKIIVNMNGL